ncbi:hypothetical protein VNI00_004549 [Paramarasmius palmivorus]|uniref:F-box domain-containing protein n=1 Tax=Paramarasmius palmivorus TaxID=297713 RepID=A0AAW0DJH3_9AGAR
MILQLPPELMAHIFRYCMASRGSTHKSKDSKAHWLSFTHVCRFWRSVALDDASLWTSFQFGHRHLSQIILERSKALPLDLWYFHHTGRKSYFDDEDELLETLRRHLHRTESLHLTICIAQNEDVRFLHRLVQPAPILRALEINSNDGFTLSADFLAGEAPSLTNLRIRSAYLSWESPLLANLTHLELRGNSRSNIPTTSQLVKALRAMPLLENLVLRGILPNIIDAAMECVALPRLHELDISGNIYQCTGLLRLVSFPVTTVLSISEDIDSDFNDVGDFDVFVFQLPLLFCPVVSSVDSEEQRDHARVTKTLFIILGGTSGPVVDVTLHAWNHGDVPINVFDSGSDSEQLDDPTPVTSPFLSLWLEWCPVPPRSWVEEDLEVLFSSLPVASVETLRIKGYPEPRFGARESNEDEDEDEDPVARNLGDLPFRATNTKSLVVSDDFMKSRIPEICAVLRSRNDSVTPPVLAFPALTTLTLLPTDGCLSFLSNRVPPSFMELLLDTLRYRSDHGRRVEVLLLAAEWFCYLSPETVARLKDVVGELREFTKCI